MRLDAIAIGMNPPDDVNVVIEVPIGGEAAATPLRQARDDAPRATTPNSHTRQLPQFATRSIRALWVP